MAVELKPTAAPSMREALARCKDLDKQERRAFLNVYFGGSDADYADYVGNNPNYNREFDPYTD